MLLNRYFYFLYVLRTIFRDFNCFFKFFKIIFCLFIFRERGKEGERSRETLMCGCLSLAPCWDVAHNPGMCSAWELNQWPFGSQAGTQSTEPHQPGLLEMFFFNVSLAMIFPLETRMSHAPFVEVRPCIMINRFGIVSCHHFLKMRSYPIFMCFALFWVF